MLKDNEEDAIKYASVSYGTGFFISNSGEVATNRHVIYPSIDNDVLSQKVNQILNEIKLKIQTAINDNQNEQSKIADLYNQYSEYIDYSRRSELKDNYFSKKNENLEYEDLLSKLEFNPSKTKTELMRVFLGIAFDDTYVTNSTDFSECVAVKKSEEESVDLAIIQLKNKSTPQSVKNTISLVKLDKIEKLKLSDEVFMIGFNYGLALAKTNNGIKSQFTQGTITQDPDNMKILYSIPTLPGSSGSPVFDKWGNLVGINYAKTGEQSFSFGIPANALVSLSNIDDLPKIVSKKTETIPAKANTIKSISKSNVQVESASKDFSSKIYSFLLAEEQRNFDEIYGYFSPRMSRFYDINNPNYNSLKVRYEYIWGFTTNSKNTVQSIERINDYAYDLNTKFSYYNLKKEQELSVLSKIRFLFDSEGLIIENYAIK